MGRVARRLAALAIILGILLPAHQALQVNLPAFAASSTSLHLQATLLTVGTTEGSRAELFVHTGALTQLRLSVRYTGGFSSSYRGITDARGRYVFSWRIPLGAHLAGRASLQLDAQRGKLRGSWSGRLRIVALPLPRLIVTPLEPRFMAGNPLGIFVDTAANAAFSYTLRADDGTIVANGTARADARGRYVIDAIDLYLPHQRTGITATVTVNGLTGTSTRTARFLLLPRPPLNLYVAATTRAVQAGDTMGVFMSSVPGTHLAVTVSLTSTVVAHGVGMADAFGRWVYTTQLVVPIKTAMTAHVTVQASHGLDQATGITTFLLRPGPISTLRNGALDRLATARDPSPNLSAYFVQVPEKLIMVSTEGQTLRAYQNGVLVHESYVTTGRPELPTVHGIFHVYTKVSPFTFISPWPSGSPFWYPPSPVRYWMPFFEGYGLHDSPWRAVYGPGTNLPHSSDPGEPVGSHGCVNIPLADMVWLWNWTPVGTTVVVY